MSVVIVSPKFQVVIARDIRETLGLEAGQKVQALRYQDRVEVTPIRPIRSPRYHYSRDAARLIKSTF